MSTPPLIEVLALLIRERRGRTLADPARACRHCHTGTICRPRRLCWRCFYTPGVKALYPSESKYGRWADVPGRYRIKRPLPTPTAAAPGSPEKVAVLMARVERGEQLFHPLDTQL